MSKSGTNRNMKSYSRGHHNVTETVKLQTKHTKVAHEVRKTSTKPQDKVSSSFLEDEINLAQCRLFGLVFTDNGRKETNWKDINNGRKETKWKDITKGKLVPSLQANDAARQLYTEGYTITHDFKEEVMGQVNQSIKETPYKPMCTVKRSKTKDRFVSHLPENGVALENKITRETDAVRQLYTDGYSTENSFEYKVMEHRQHNINEKPGKPMCIAKRSKTLAQFVSHLRENDAAHAARQLYTEGYSTGHSFQDEVTERRHQTIPPLGKSTYTAKPSKTSGRFVSHLRKSDIALENEFSRETDAARQLYTEGYSTGHSFDDDGTEQQNQTIKERRVKPMCNAIRKNSYVAIDDVDLL